MKSSERPPDDRGTAQGLACVDRNGQLEKKQRVNADVVISKKDKSLSLKICAHLCAMNYGTGYIRSFMHYRMELRLTMEIAVQKCLMDHVRMKEGFVFMEKW